MIITLTGPSGIGKGYVACELKKHLPSLRELVWLTTRSLRPGEENRANRKSVSREEFLILAKIGSLALVQELYGNLYGLKLTGVNYDQGLWICELHIDNLQQAREIDLPIFSIALVPNEVAFLDVRLRSYRETKDESEIVKRLSVAEQEISKIAQNRAFFDAFFEVTAENEHWIVDNVIETLRQLQGGKTTR